MKDVLIELTEMRRRDAEMREAVAPFAEMMKLAESAPAPRDFAAAFGAAGRSASAPPRVIAELKRASPSEGMIRDDFRPVELARELLRRGWAYTLQATMVIPYPGTPLFRECKEKGLLLTERWEDFDMRTQIMRTPVSEDEIKCAIRSIYRGFLHPQALWNRLLHTRHPIEDARFYLRGAISLLGHLRDFGG